ncbi:MAG TPA: hypothetical protein DCE75_10410, partial [Acidimicrobiaceae bacterium]|nr:hypothetical protein [Acidimicrobiaceae bacterium]
MRSPSRAVTEQPISRLGVLLGALAVLVAACGGGTDAGFDALNIPTTAPDWLIERAGDATTTFEVSERSYNLSARN